MSELGEFVVCMVCGRKLHSLCAHVQIHGITIKEYKKKYPGCQVLSERTRRLKSEAAMGHIVDLETRYKIGASSRGKTFEEFYGEERAKEIKDRLSKGQLESYKDNPERAINLSEKGKRNWERPEYRELVIVNSKQGVLSMSLEAKQRHATLISEGQTRVWAGYSPEERSRRVKIWIKANQVKPNGPEQFFIGICDDNDFPFSYCGDGELIIEGKIPDFVSDNKIVEIFGDYWHAREDEEERIEFFRKRGFDCLVIWESDLLHNTDLVLDRVGKYLVK